MAVPQKFQMSLSGTIYNFRLYWNTVGQYWVLDIADSSGNPLVTGVPLVTGCLLLSQYSYMGFPGDLFVQTTNNPDEVPSFDSLGSTANIFYVAGQGAGA